MSRTSHYATVDRCKSFRIKEAADRRIVIERHLTNFEFGIYRDLETKEKATHLEILCGVGVRDTREVA